MALRLFLSLLFASFCLAFPSAYTRNSTNICPQLEIALGNASIISPSETDYPSLSSENWYSFSCLPWAGLVLIIPGRTQHGGNHRVLRDHQPHQTCRKWFDFLPRRKSRLRYAPAATRHHHSRQISTMESSSTCRVSTIPNTFPRETRQLSVLEEGGLVYTTNLTVTMSLPSAGGL